MYDIVRLRSTTLLNMPTKVRAMVIKIDDWNYIICNQNLNCDILKEAYLHEIKHIELKHLDNYDINNLREELEREVKGR